MESVVLLLWLATSYIQDGSGVDGWSRTGDLMEGFGAGCWRRSVGSLKEVVLEGGGAGALREREREAKRPVINQTPSTCHLSSLPPVLSLSILPPVFYPAPPSLLLSNHFFCSKSKCSIVLYYMPPFTAFGLQHTHSQTSLWEVFNAITRWQPGHYALQQGEMDWCRG